MARHIPANTWADERGVRPAEAQAPLPSWVDRRSSWRRSKGARTGLSTGPRRRRQSQRGGRTREWGGSSRRLRDWVRTHRRQLVVAAATVAAVAVVAGVVVAVVGLGSGRTAQQPPVAAAPVTPAGDSGLECVAKSGSVTEGNGPGDRTSATGVIMAYEHAFFAERDAAAMVALTTPGDEVAGEDVLRRGLEQIPQGVRWCVTITEGVRPDTHTVTLRFVSQSGRVVTWRQVMTVVKRNAAVADSWTITSVVAAK